MRRRHALLLIGGCVVSVAACTRGTQGARQAQTAAEAWLAELDRGNYEGCWELASSTLRSREERAAWLRAVQQARAQIGQIARRVLAESYPGKPTAGARPFFNLVFRVERVIGRTAGEFVSVEEGADGQWRVTGYRAVGVGALPGGER